MMRYGQKDKVAGALVGTGEGLAQKDATPSAGYFVDHASAFQACHDALLEYRRAREQHAPMRGPHEGYAVILEELDEAWDAIKANDIVEARKEIKQVAAMCLAFLTEVQVPEKD